MSRHSTDRIDGLRRLNTADWISELYNAPPITQTTV